MRRRKVFILLSLLGALSIFFVVRYRGVLAADSQYEAVVAEMRVMEVECNRGDAQICTVSGENGSFWCNLTLCNFSHQNITLLNIDVRHDWKTSSAVYLIARGSDSYDRALAPGAHDFALELVCVPYAAKPPPDPLTIPSFTVEVAVKYGFSARYLRAGVSNFTAGDTTVVARHPTDQTYSLLLMYPRLTIGIWVIGVGAYLLHGLAKGKALARVKLLAAAHFLMLSLFFLSIYLIQYIRLPPPYVQLGFTPPGGGLAGLHALASIFVMITIVLGLVTAVLAFAAPRKARLLGAVTFILFLLSMGWSILAGFVTRWGIDSASLILLSGSVLILMATTLLALARLTSRSVPNSSEALLSSPTLA